MIDLGDAALIVAASVDSARAALRGGLRDRDESGLLATTATDTDTEVVDQ